MNAYKAYKIYIALKSHFTSWSYDALKYNFKTNSSQDSFIKRNDVLRFESVSNKYGESVGAYFISNFVEREENFLYDPLKSDRIYSDWTKRRNNKVSLVRSEILSLPYKSIDDIIKTDGQAPILLREYLVKNISPETLVLLDSEFQFLDKWKSALICDPLWQAVGLVLCKYRSFVSFDESLLKSFVNQKFGAI